MMLPSHFRPDFVERDACQFFYVFACSFTRITQVGLVPTGTRRPQPQTLAERRVSHRVTQDKLHQLFGSQTSNISLQRLPTRGGLLAFTLLNLQPTEAHRHTMFAESSQRPFRTTALEAELS